MLHLQSSSFCFGRVVPAEPASTSNSCVDNGSATFLIENQVSDIRGN